MNLTGKLVVKLPVTTYGKEGKKKGGFVLEYGDKYPKKVACTVFEKNLPLAESLVVGQEVVADVVVESREWQGKWFTDVVAMKFAASGAVAKKEEAFQVQDNKGYGDLPF
jgi:hypothetical protein